MGCSTSAAATSPALHRPRADATRAAKTTDAAYDEAMRWVVIATIVLAGCGSVRSGMRASFADRASCPESEISVHRLLDRIARVSGCGTYVDYAEQWSVFEQ